MCLGPERLVPRNNPIEIYRRLKLQHAGRKPAISSSEAETYVDMHYNGLRESALSVGFRPTNDAGRIQGLKDNIREGLGRRFNIVPD